MSIYKPMYNKLFSQITDTIEVLEKELEKLKDVQIETEEVYINTVEVKSHQEINHKSNK